MEKIKEKHARWIARRSSTLLDPEYLFTSVLLSFPFLPFPFLFCSWMMMMLLPPFPYRDRQRREESANQRNGS